MTRQLGVDEGRCLPSAELNGDWVPPTIDIRAGPDEPADAFAAVRYHDHWYWIEDRDFGSKRRFTFLLLLTSPAETGASPAAPLITVGAGG
jgi:hypothetical protein